MQCKLVSYCTAGSSVEAATTLVASVGQRSGKMKEKQKLNVK